MDDQKVDSFGLADSIRSATVLRTAHGKLGNQSPPLHRYLRHLAQEERIDWSKEQSFAYEVVLDDGTVLVGNTEPSMDSYSRKHSWRLWVNGGLAQGDGFVVMLDISMHGDITAKFLG
ncbi:MAG: hypothetical protein Q8P30_02880 [Candidatus Uhrbacteria bacterium]|nr:hypothetical protein [Candidatus Uhrbacteria bacterium]